MTDDRLTKFALRGAAAQAAVDAALGEHDALPEPPELDDVACVVCRANAVAVYISDRVGRIAARGDVDGDNRRAALTHTCGLATGLMLRAVGGPLSTCAKHGA